MIDVTNGNVGVSSICFRYNEIEIKLTEFLESCGYNLSKDVTFIPISGLTGQNVKLRATDPTFILSKDASWCDASRPTLFDILNTLKTQERYETDPLRIAVMKG